MNIEPLKKVGSPASFKGVRGDYLTKLIMNLCLLLFLALLIIMIPIPSIIQLVVIVFFILLFLYKYNELKKLSKGDIYQETKIYSRKRVQIISSPINKSKYGQNNKN